MADEARRAVKTLKAAEESGAYQKKWFRSLHERVAATCPWRSSGPWISLSL